MAARNRKNIICLWVVGSMCAALPRSQATEPNVDGEVHAKGITVLRETFPTRGEVWRFTLSSSQDGKEFREAGFGRLGVPDLFRSIAYHEGTTTIIVPVVGWFQTEISFFGEPGTYWFRWGITFRDQGQPRTVPDQVDEEIEPVTMVRVIQARPPRPVDLDFVAGLGEPDLLRAIAGDGFFEHQTGNASEEIKDPEVRAVMVIGRLLLSTRKDWVGDIMREAGPRGDIHKAAEMLLSLAKRFPESSYAPYAAHYAGCCYFSACIDKAEEAIRVRTKQGGLANDLALGKYRVTLLKQNPDLARAYEAFTLAAQRADDYLKPRTLYQHGTMRLFSFDFDEAERLLTEAARVVPGERMLQKWFDKKFGGIAQLHTYIEKAKVRVQGVEDSASDTPKP